MKTKKEKKFFSAAKKKKQPLNIKHDFFLTSHMGWGPVQCPRNIEILINFCFNPESQDGVEELNTVDFDLTNIGCKKIKF